MSNILNSAAPQASAALVPDAASGKRPGLRLRLTRHSLWRGLGLFALLAVMVLAAFGPFPWQILGQATLLLSVVVVVVLAVGLLLITLGVAAITRRHTRVLPWVQRSLRLSLALFILLVGVTGATLGSQWHASTPPILDASGQPLSGSISALEQVTLNGSQQWITIRGKNVHHPVLLFLMGGPGAGGFPDNQGFLTQLEDHFVVVNWDQPGTGKSYNAVPITTLTPQRYIEDAHALVMQLRARFQQDKIYLLGSPWGSILGIWLVQRYPEMFYAYVSHGQMVNTTENDIIGYQFALKYAAEHSDSATVNTLRRNGPPPYVGDGMIWKYTAYLNVLYDYMGLSNLKLLVPLMPQFSPEYGLVDKVNFVRGFVESFTVMYPQLKDLDFMRSANKLDVPVYLLVGSKDMSAVASLAERYYQVLQAPRKELIWFPPGHSMSSQEDMDQFVDVMVNHMLAQTWPRH